MVSPFLELDFSSGSAQPSANPAIASIGSTIRFTRDSSPAKKLLLLAGFIKARASPAKETVSLFNGTPPSHSQRRVNVDFLAQSAAGFNGCKAIVNELEGEWLTAE